MVLYMYYKYYYNFEHTPFKKISTLQFNISEQNDLCRIIPGIKETMHLKRFFQIRPVMGRAEI